MEPTRRSLLLGSAAFAAYFSAHGDALAQPPRRHLGRLSELSPGMPVLLSYPSEAHPVLLVRLDRPARFGVGDDQATVCFSTACTHQGCPLIFSKGRMLCKCHFSQFDPAVGGQCYQGPAHESLPQVLLELDGDEIYAVGIVGLPWGRVDSPT